MARGNRVLRFHRAFHWPTRCWPVKVARAEPMSSCLQQSGATRQLRFVVSLLRATVASEASGSALSGYGYIGMNIAKTCQHVHIAKLPIHEQNCVTNVAFGDSAPGLRIH